MGTWLGITSLILHFRVRCWHARKWWEIIDVLPHHTSISSRIIIKLLVGIDRSLITGYCDFHTYCNWFKGAKCGSNLNEIQLFLGLVCLTDTCRHAMPNVTLQLLPWISKPLPHSLTKMQPISWSNGRLRPRLGPQPLPSELEPPKSPRQTESAPSIQDLLPETTRVTQTARKRQRALTKSKLARYLINYAPLMLPNATYIRIQTN